ncbi:MAG: sulfate permease [Methanoregula sp.]|nr:sulfate permease [Methanoregula sp.]
MPGIGLVRTYNRNWLKADLVAGVTVFAILVPSCLAYGELAGFEPVIGLYAALVAMIAYALFGSSRQLIVGPDATIAILIALIVAPLALGDSARYAALAAALTILIGLTCLIGGYFKLGFVADFLSKPILTGYITATALIVIVSQLGKIFGIEIVSDDFFAQILELITKLDQTHMLTLALGLVTILGLILLKRFVPRVPGPLVAVVVAIIVSSLFNFADLGVSVVGQIPGGLPSLQIPQVGPADLRTLLPAALALAVLIFADELLVARVFAKKNHYALDPNQELTALGAANVSCGFFESFAVGASSSRTVVNDDMRGKSQMVGLVAAGLVIVFLLYLTSLLQNLPKVVLGAVIVVAAISLIDVQEFRSLNLIRHSEFYLSLLTLLGVLIIGIVVGIAVAIAFSLAEFLLRIYRPHTSVLGTGEGVDGYHVIAPGGYNQVLPGLIVYGFNAPLFFANAPYLLDQVRDLISTAVPPVRCLLLDTEAIPDIDTTAADTLRELHQELQEKSIVLTIARANKPLRETMRLTGLENLIGAKNFYPSVRTGVEAFRMQSLESES